MGTVTIPGLVSDIIKGPIGVDIIIAGTTFPITDSAPRSKATFGGTGEFIVTSERQEVLTATATIAAGITIVGVNFNGPVVLTFADPGVDLSDIYVVDEGGFASDTNTITATAATTTMDGDFVISNPFTSMHIRGNATGWFSEYSNTVLNPDGSTTTEEDDGSTTVVLPDGTTTNTSADGNTVFTTNPDGSTVLDVADGNMQTTTTVLADGTIIVHEADTSQGNTTTNTTYPDGSTLEETATSGGNTTSLFTAVDGTTTEIATTSGGNVDQTITSPDGTVTSSGSTSNGSNYNSVVNPDGSSYSFDQQANGSVEIITIDAAGNEVREDYKHNKSFYTVYTTPFGGSTTSQTFSPNPYQVVF